MSRTASEDGWSRTKATQAVWNASVVGMSRRNAIHFKNAQWMGPNCCPPPSALFSLYAPTSLLRAYLHLTFLFSTRRARFHEAVFRQQKLSRCLVACSFTHSIRILTSSYLCQTCVGGVEFETFKVESNLDQLSGVFLHWSSGLWSKANKKISLFGQREETLLKNEDVKQDTDSR